MALFEEAIRMTVLREDATQTTTSINEEALVDNIVGLQREWLSLALNRLERL
jgi:hypothetical protein